MSAICASASTRDPQAFEVEVQSAVQAELNRLREQRAKAPFGPTDAGTILQAHLIVQLAIRRYIEELNPKLGSLVDVRLTFAQLVSMYEQNEHHLPWLVGGVRALNKVRNAIGHDLDAEIPSRMLDPMLKFVAEMIRDDNQSAPRICAVFATYACASLAAVKAAVQKADQAAWQAAAKEAAIRTLGEFSPPADGAE
jgi:hypothetical protein